MTHVQVLCQILLQEIYGLDCSTTHQSEHTLVQCNVLVCSIRAVYAIRRMKAGCSGDSIFRGVFLRLLMRKAQQLPMQV